MRPVTFTVTTDGVSAYLEASERLECFGNVNLHAEAHRAQEQALAAFDGRLSDA